MKLYKITKSFSTKTQSRLGNNRLFTLIIYTFYCFVHCAEVSNSNPPPSSPDSLSKQEEVVLPVKETKTIIQDLINANNEVISVNKQLITMIKELKKSKTKDKESSLESLGETKAKAIESMDKTLEHTKESLAHLNNFQEDSKGEGVVTLYGQFQDIVNVFAQKYAFLINDIINDLETFRAFQKNEDKNPDSVEKKMEELLTKMISVEYMCNDLSKEINDSFKHVLQTEEYEIDKQNEDPLSVNASKNIQRILVVCGDISKEEDKVKTEFERVIKLLEKMYLELKNSKFSMDIDEEDKMFMDLKERIILAELKINLNKMPYFNKNEGLNEKFISKEVEEIKQSFNDNMKNISLINDKNHFTKESEKNISNIRKLFNSYKRLETKFELITKIVSILKEMSETQIENRIKSLLLRPKLEKIEDKEISRLVNVLKNDNDNTAMIEKAEIVQELEKMNEKLSQSTGHLTILTETMEDTFNPKVMKKNSDNKIGGLPPKDNSNNSSNIWIAIGGGIIIFLIVVGGLFLKYKGQVNG